MNRIISIVLLTVASLLFLSSCVSQIHSAVNRDEPEKIRRILAEEEGALEERNHEDLTPLLSAAKQNNFDLVQLLVEEGADVNAQTKVGGLTPLRYAIMEGNYLMAEYLIDNGADVNQKNEHGWTPMHTAARYGEIDILNLLIENGADISPRTEEGLTPTRVASNEGYTDIVVRLTLLQQERLEEETEAARDQ
jgi:ankyrin repeat protein